MEGIILSITNLYVCIKTAMLTISLLCTDYDRDNAIIPIIFLNPIQEFSLPESRNLANDLLLG